MDYLMILIGIGGGDYLFLRLFIPHYFYGGLFGVLNGWKKENNEFGLTERLNLSFKNYVLK